MAGIVGIYIGQTLDELNAKKVIALDRIENGDRTSLSGAGKSSGRTYSLSAIMMLREVNYALGLLNGTGGVSRTYFNASGQCQGR